MKICIPSGRKNARTTHMNIINLLSITCIIYTLVCSYVLLYALCVCVYLSDLTITIFPLLIICGMPEAICCLWLALYQCNLVCAL